MFRLLSELSCLQRLHEISLQFRINQPEFEFVLVAPGGPFHCDCTFFNLSVSGVGQTKRDAKLEAARAVLSRWIL